MNKQEQKTKSQSAVLKNLIFLIIKISEKKDIKGGKERFNPQLINQKKQNKGLEIRNPFNINNLRLLNLA